MLHVILREIL